MTADRALTLQDIVLDSSHIQTQGVLPTAYILTDGETEEQTDEAT